MIFSNFVRGFFVNALGLCILSAMAASAFAQDNGGEDAQAGAAISAPDLSASLAGQGGGSPEFKQLMSQLQQQNSSSNLPSGAPSLAASSGGGDLMGQLQSMTTTMAIENANGTQNGMTFGDICGSFLTQILARQNAGDQSLDPKDIAYLRSICAQNAAQKVEAAAPR